MAAIRLTYTSARESTDAPLVGIITLREREYWLSRPRFHYKAHVLVADTAERAIVALARLQDRGVEIYDVTWVQPGRSARWPRAELVEAMRSGIDVASDWLSQLAEAEVA
jgi:hypothetical protein